MERNLSLMDGPLAFLPDEKDGLGLDRLHIEHWVGFGRIQVVPEVQGNFLVDMTPLVAVVASLTLSSKAEPQPTSDSLPGDTDVYRRLVSGDNIEFRPGRCRVGG